MPLSTFRFLERASKQKLSKLIYGREKNCVAIKKIISDYVLLQLLRHVSQSE